MANAWRAGVTTPRQAKRVLELFHRTPTRTTGEGDFALTGSANAWTDFT